MEQLEKDLLVIGKFKNAKLYDLMGGRTNADVCREIDMEQTTFGALLNLKKSPVKEDGTFTSAAQKIADYFKVLPEDLFPASLYALTLPKQLEKRYASEAVLLSLESREAKQLEAGSSLEDTVFKNEMAQQVQALLCDLSPREAKILEMRFGLNGEVESLTSTIGERFNVCTGRILQIEARALRHLRRPDRSRKLRPFMDEVGAD